MHLTSAAVTLSKSVPFGNCRHITYHAVNILVRAALARAIRMAVIDRRPLCILVPGAPLDAVSIRELGAVVYDYRFENLIEHRAVNTLEAV